MLMRYVGETNKVVVAHNLFTALRNYSIYYLLPPTIYDVAMQTRAE